MSLRALQRQWDRFGRADPLWAVLSLPDKRHGGWDEAEFFATGAREVADVLAHARALGVEPDRSRALDFGCGVGRLSRALAAHFERVDGVDIAPSMLERAERYNRDPGRCFFHLNARSDLSLFPDGTFSFVYTSLVLQHMDTGFARAYIREFVRVLAPGGLLVFHLPSEPFPESAAGAARRSFARGPLPPAAFQARVASAMPSAEADAGQVVALKLRVHNDGPHAWPALAGASARFQVTVGARFRTPAGELVETPEARTPLPHDILPGAGADVFLRAPLPRWPGEYLLELDLVQEDVAWFHDRSGRAPLRLPCRALGSASGEPARLRERHAARAGAFQRRHPHVHFVLARLLRVPRALAALRGLHSVVTWHARMGSRVAREAARRAWDPPMEMNGIPRPEVERLLADAGGRLLEAESSELTHAGWQAYRYFVLKHLTRPPSRT